MSGHVHNTNAGCCSNPPVQSDYKSKGSYEKVGEFEKAYVVGFSKSNALICVYDIFGFYPQTEQGADILSVSLDAKVIMPDFFKGKPWDLNKFPPSSDEDKEELQKFFGGIANPQERLKELVSLTETLKSEGYTNIGLYGFCWGGKVSFLAGTHPDLFKGICIVHPAMLDVSDVEGLSVPLVLFPSKEEPEDEVMKIGKAIQSKPFADKCVHKTYSDQIHGFAAARADLEDPKVKAAYEDVYERISTFFKGLF